MENQIKICLCGDGEVGKSLKNYLSSVGKYGGYDVRLEYVWSDVYDIGDKLGGCDVVINTLMADISHTFDGEADTYSASKMVRDTRVLFEIAERSNSGVIHISRDYSFPPKFGLIVPSEDSARGTPSTSYGTHLLFAESISEAFDNVKTLRISELYGKDIAWYSFAKSLRDEGMQAFLPGFILRTFMDSSAFCESTLKSAILFGALPKFLNLGDGNRKSYYSFAADTIYKDRKDLLVKTEGSSLRLGLRSKYAANLGIG